jgi:hypothetical protein
VSGVKLSNQYQHTGENGKTGIQLSEQQHSFVKKKQNLQQLLQMPLFIPTFKTVHSPQIFFLH